MGSSDTRIYNDLFDKVAFGNLLESAMAKTTANRKKSKLISNFLDNQTEELFNYKRERYVLIVDREKYPDETTNNYAGLKQIDLSKEFIEVHIDIVCPEKIHYLEKLVVDLSIARDLIGFDIVTYQLMILILINQLLNEKNLHRSEATQKFFENMAREQYQTDFRRALDDLRNSLEQPDEDEKEDESLGHGDLDPVQVIKSLPKVLLECFQSRDLGHLKEVLSKMAEEEAAQYVDHCFRSGLLVSHAKAGQDDDEQEATTNDDQLVEQ